MTLIYGLVKCKVVSEPFLKSTRGRKETQYHVHATLSVPSPDGEQKWDTAINVGTNASNDLLKYKVVFDYQHPIIETLRSTQAGLTELTDAGALPALDFLRSDLLNATGPWRLSDVMDGSEQQDPAASVMRLLLRAKRLQADVYIFGRLYADGTLGIHDIHMNQGSTGKYINNGLNNQDERNAVWQDGAVVVDFGLPEWAAYFTVFTQQLVPTDALGNPVDASHHMGDTDPGSLRNP